MKSLRWVILPEFYWFDLGHRPIFEQLQIEETLLRASELSCCLINRGSPLAIVMGISGRPEEQLDVHRVIHDRVPVIQRCSGGGTVVVDHNTLFISFLFQKEALPIHPFPEPILRWSGDLYTESWKIPSFHLVENDYAIGARKCGGNAQYIRKNRWLHHTTFLWDYSPDNMRYLLLPPKQPVYRQNRDHDSFLCRLKEHASSRETLISQLKAHLSQRFDLKETPLPSIAPPSRCSVHFVNLGY
jgi:lipoate-protein ligase A